jgi:hypothetical protein
MKFLRDRLHHVCCFDACTADCNRVFRERTEQLTLYKASTYLAKA